MKQILKEIALEVNKNVLYTTGIDTKVFRKQHGLPKGHDIDSLVIACNCLKLDCDLMYPHSVKLVKYRRHSSRAIVTRREDRKYYEIESRKCIAKNRRKRTGQTFDSLQDYLKENRNHLPLRVTPGRVVERIDWTTQKKKLRNEIPRFIARGALIQYTENEQKKYGVASRFEPRHYKIILETGREVKLKQFNRILKFGGIASIF